MGREGCPAGRQKQRETKAWPGGGVERLAEKRGVCSRCLQPKAVWELREVQEPRHQVYGIVVDTEPGPTSAKAKVKLGCAGNCLLSSASGNLCLKWHFALSYGKWGWSSCIRQLTGPALGLLFSGLREHLFGLSKRFFLLFKMCQSKGFNRCVMVHGCRCTSS